MTPGKYDLALYRGDTWRAKFELWNKVDGGSNVAVDLTGALVAAEYRDKPNGSAVVVLACTVTLPNVIEVEFTPAMWDAGAPASGVWDLEVTMADGTISTVVAGRVTVTADVTGSEPIVREVRPVFRSARPGAIPRPVPARR